MADERKPPVSWTPVSSSNVDAVKHDGDDPGTLFVRFKGGAIYAYEGVPLSLFFEFLASDSKGQFVWRRLRDKFPYGRV